MIDDILSLDTLRDYLTDDLPTLVALDIDETILRAPDHWGSEAWYEERIQSLIGKGEDPTRATYQANSEWEAIQTQIKMVPTEPQTIQLLKEIQTLEATRLMGITARRPSLAALTTQQLQQFGFSFEAHAPLDAQVKVSANSQYLGGILFVGPINKKGIELRSLLPHFQFQPHRIIFVDDRLHQVHSVSELSGNTPLDIIALHYCGKRS